jgi:hypothetical protein
LVYHDRNGGRWQVYDRRGRDRRQSAPGPRNAPDAAGHRTFVNDAGEEWHVQLAATDFLDESPDALEKQLSRATKLQ